MKIYALLFALGIANMSYSGGFRWPNVDYSYAQLYLFNIKDGKPTSFDFHIYADSIYAKSKLGTGIEVSEELLDKMHGLIARHANGMRIGLSKCYIPRHGIIYYDKVGTPVASLSICFECDKISLWSVNQLQSADYDQRTNYDKVEKAFDEIEKSFLSHNLPVFEREDAYLEYKMKSEEYTNEGEIFIESNTLDSLYFKRYSIEEVNSWVKGDKLRLTETKETKITAGGEEWTYPQLSSREGASRFVFSFDEENPYLIEATITDNEIILPSGVSVGMSVEDVQNSLGVYDGIAFPEYIQVKGEKLTLEYFFENRTLVKIKAGFSII